MKKLPIITFTVLVLSACTTPIVFQPSELQNLKDTQLCNLLYSYGSEPNLVNEINNRGVNCDPVYQTCLAEGHKGKKLKQCMSRYNQLVYQEQQKQQAVNQCKQVARARYNPFGTGDSIYRDMARVDACNMIATNPQAYQQTIQSFDASEHNERMKEQMQQYQRQNDQIYCQEFGGGVICNKM